jgi:hypothetical protein
MQDVKTVQEDIKQKQNKLRSQKLDTLVAILARFRKEAQCLHFQHVSTIS